MFDRRDFCRLYEVRILSRSPANHLEHAEASPHLHEFLRKGEAIPMKGSGFRKEPYPVNTIISMTKYSK